MRPEVLALCRAAREGDRGAALALANRLTEAGDVGELAEVLRLAFRIPSESEVLGRSFLQFLQDERGPLPATRRLLLMSLMLRVESGRDPTVGDVCLHTGDELRAFKGFGRSSLQRLRVLLWGHGLTLADGIKPDQIS